LNRNARSTTNLLAAAIDALLKNPDVQCFVITRTKSGQGIEACNIFTGNPEIEQPLLATYQEFKQGHTTIYDKDPEWKQHYKDVEEDLA